MQKILLKKIIVVAILVCSLSTASAMWNKIGHYLPIPLCDNRSEFEQVVSNNNLEMALWILEETYENKLSSITTFQELYTFLLGQHDEQHAQELYNNCAI